MSEIYSLDIESRSTVRSMSDHAALEPWRVRQGKAEMSSVAVCRPDGSVTQIVNDCSIETWRQRVRSLLGELKGKVVYAHDAPFDVAWNLGTIQPERCGSIPDEIRDIRWRCTRLLTKWLINGQRAELADYRYSLINTAKTFLKDHPRIEEFSQVKGQKVIAGDDEEYWLGRGEIDVVMTRDLADKLQGLLPVEQRVGFLTECDCIVPIADSRLNGIRIDVDRIREVEAYLDGEMDRHANAIGVAQTVLNSPQQLGHLLFDDWGLKPLKYGRNGGSTAKDDLLVIQYEQCQEGDLRDRMSHVMHFKKNSTLKSKYIKTLHEALDHSGDGHIYGVPRLFGTYTGRLTYSNSTLQRKYKVSIALHQLPRPKGGKVIDVSKQVKMIRGLLTPPEGMGLVENDASGQESRLMALRSGDEAMLKVFKDDLNFHSMTGSAICGMDYYDFMERFKEEHGTGHFTEQRQLGKLTNLSCNYRIGGRSLAKKAFADYDTYMTDDTGYFLTRTFQRQYPGVPAYWKDIVQFAKTMGYTECYGNRRYKIHMWDGENSWRSESSAINMPIQGGGASQKEIAISVAYRKFPEVHFGLDLHDGLFHFVPGEHTKELEKEVNDELNRIDYEPYWGFKPQIPLPFESMSGNTFEDVK